MKNETTKKGGRAKAVPATKPNPITRDDLVAALDRLFTEGGWEIPDEAVEGKLTRKVEQLEARLNNLTSLVATLTKPVNGHAVPGQRVDVITPKKGK